MSPRKVNTENQDRRRQAIIKAGYAEILEKGIHGTTIDSMVGRANSSKGMRRAEGNVRNFRTLNNGLTKGAQLPGPKY